MGRIRSFVAFSAVVVSILTLTGTGKGGQRPAESAPAPQLDTRGLDAFEEGQRAHQQGRLPEAIALYDKAIELDAELWGAHFQRGVALLQSGKPVEAERSLRRAVEIEQEFAAAHAALGNALLALDRPADAIVEFRRAFAIDPALVQARANFAVALWRTSAWADAERELILIETQNAATADTETLHAEVCLKLERKADAARYYDQALARNPRHSDALIGRSRLRMAAGDLEGAVADLTLANQVQPSPELASELAALSARSNDPERALGPLRERVRVEPASRAARRDLAEMLVRAGKLDEAKSQTDALVALAPNDPASHEMAGDVFAEKAPLDASRYYVWAARLAPEAVTARLKLGTALVRATKFAECVEPLAFVIAKRPNERDAHAGLAAAYYALHEFADAAREFGWLAEHEPDAAFVQFYLGASLDRTGECSKAIAAFERFLQLADASADGARIGEVNLRLPGLRRQAELGCRKSAGK